MIQVKTFGNGVFKVGRAMSDKNKEFIITATFTKRVEAESEEEAREIWGNSDCNGEIENITIEEASDE